MRFLLGITALLLSACASPDIGAFKQSTLALTTGLKENQIALVASGETISAQLGNPDPLQTRITKLKGQQGEIDEATAVLAAYASAVASLASSGTDGADAAQTMLGNVTTTVGSVSGTIPKLPGIIGSITAVLGQIVQQKQNQKLYQIMSAVRSDVNKLAGVLTAAQNAEVGIVNAFARYWRNERNDLINYHEAYKDLAAQAQTIDNTSGLQLSNDIKRCIAAVTCDYPALSTAHQNNQNGNAAKRADLQKLINEIRPYEESYQAWEKEIVAWQQTSIQRIAAIPNLATAWQNDHNAIISYLERCTGASSVFDSSCGAFSTANLELFGALLGKAVIPF